MSAGVFPPAGVATNSGAVLLGIYTASAGASIDCVTRNQGGASGAIFQSDFDEYEVVIDYLQNNTSASFVRFRASTNGGSTFDSGANYNSNTLLWRAGGSGLDGGAGTTFLYLTSPIANGMNTNAAGGATGRFTIYKPLSSSIWKQVSGRIQEYAATVNTYLIHDFMGAYISTTPMNAFQILPSTGTTTGTILVYGLAKTAVVGSTVIPANGLTLLNTQTASASATLDFSTRNAPGTSGALFQSDFDVYEFQMVGILPATNAVDLQVRMGTGAGPTWDTGNNYQWSLAQWSQTGAGASIGGNAVAFIKILNSLGNTATGALGTTLNLYDPLSAASHKFVDVDASYIDSSPNYNRMVSGGRYMSATALTGLRFFMSSGNIASGTIRCYGRAK